VLVELALNLIISLPNISVIVQDFFDALFYCRLTLSLGSFRQLA
jgi:hypothetical protein